MTEYRSSSHTVYDIKYHFVWITKYRYKILRGKIAIRAREILKQGCEANGFVIGTKEKVLGTAYVGKRIFLWNSRRG